MSAPLKNAVFALVLLVFTSLSLFAQEEPVAEPTPPDDSIRIFTEEVRLNVTAQAANGRFVPNLTPDDLLIVESGTPQRIESMKKVPASVLLLLDTGGNLNFAKSIDRTRLTAKVLVETVSDGNSLAVLQAYNKIETVADWTQNRASVQNDLDKKLFGGNTSRFSDALGAALEMFASRPPENRHLVYIGDALDTLATAEQRQKAFQDLLAANVTVHVIAYNKMETERAKGAARPFQIGEERESPRVPDHVLESIIAGLPPPMRDNFRRFAKSERLFIVRLDRKAVKLAKQKRADWMRGEAELQSIAEDTGGFFQAPEALETMWLAAVEIARAVDSQYVVTYIPSKPFADADRTEERKVRVSTHCSGVQIRARQKVVLYKPAAR